MELSGAIDSYLEYDVLIHPLLNDVTGIGNATLLKEHGITAQVDLPNVGENLQVSDSQFNVVLSFWPHRAVQGPCRCPGKCRLDQLFFDPSS